MGVGFFCGASADDFEFGDLTDPTGLTLFIGNDDAQRAGGRIEGRSVAAKDEQDNLVGHGGIQFGEGEEGLIAVGGPDSVLGPVAKPSYKISRGEI